MGRDNTVKFKERSQNRMHNRVLIVSLVLGVGVENNPDSIRGFRDEEWIHSFLI
jgi:hypothetical protein